MGGGAARLGVHGSAGCCLPAGCRQTGGPVSCGRQTAGSAGPGLGCLGAAAVSCAREPAPHRQRLASPVLSLSLSLTHTHTHCNCNASVARLRRPSAPPCTHKRDGGGRQSGALATCRQAPAVLQLPAAAAAASLSRGLSRRWREPSMGDDPSRLRAPSRRRGGVADSRGGRCGGLCAARCWWA